MSDAERIKQPNNHEAAHDEPDLAVTAPDQTERVLDELAQASEPASAQDTHAAAQTKAALQEALSSIETPEQADKVLDDLERSAGAATQGDVADRVPQPHSAAAAARSIEQAADAPREIKAQTVIAQAAAQIVAADDEDEPAIAQGVQEALSPETFAVQQPANEEERRMLQQALLRRLKPVRAADAWLFLAINNGLPHPPLVNKMMYALTVIMNRGDGWVLGLLLATLFDRKRGRRALMDVLPALWLATATVEFPIKRFVRRRRPFISLVQAIVIGRKPSHYSFPSGHSAAAFGGAWLISRHFPRLAPLLYAIASLVGFSRVYLGAHYPGDVLSGATSGVMLAAMYRRMIEAVSDELGD